MATLPDKRLQQLANKFLKGTLTDAEQAAFDAWFHAQPNEQQEVPAAFGETAEEQRERLFAKIAMQTTRQAPVRHLWPRIAAAASVLLVLSAGVYFLSHKNQTKNQTIAQIQAHDIPPGHNQATLQLANGKKIILTQNLAGKLAQQGNMLIQVNPKNAIAYSPNGQSTTEKISYNILSTGTGEQSPYPLLLSDGTQVLLDAKSSITFPVAFNGERRVKITGKAWFKVNAIKDRPFYVEAGGQTTKEIGTEFVVDAYDDEPAIRTTLVEGSIMVNSTLLKPGQQAINSGSAIRLKDADLQETLAWVNGNFRYNDESIQYIMRELARWYDIDVRYQGNMSTDGFNGKISRYKNISEVLAMLESTKLVHFKVEGRRVTVLP